MRRYLFDTDQLTLFGGGRVTVGRRVAVGAPGTVGISVMTVEEILRRRLVGRQ